MSQTTISLSQHLGPPEIEEHHLDLARAEHSDSVDRNITPLSSLNDDGLRDSKHDLFIRQGSRNDMKFDNGTDAHGRMVDVLLDGRDHRVVPIDIATWVSQIHTSIKKLHLCIKWEQELGDGTTKLISVEHNFTLTSSERTGGEMRMTTAYPKGCTPETMGQPILDHGKEYHVTRGLLVRHLETQDELAIKYDHIGGSTGRESYTLKEECTETLQNAGVLYQWQTFYVLNEVPSEPSPVGESKPIYLADSREPEKHLMTNFRDFELLPHRPKGWRGWDAK